ncbi:hypothetical protein HK097_009419, partial [Rhizophlyctis rosea]
MAAELSPPSSSPNHHPHRPASGRPIPVSTYRVQLRKEFGFEKAAEQVDYLNRLGVTHLYCSPYLQASPNSAHGYDVVDHRKINEELGGQEGFNHLSQTLRKASLGAIADIVPNHVSVSDPENLNPYWWSLLKHGRTSPYASWFDVEWDHPALKDKVILPVLGSPLDEILSKGELKVEDGVGADGKKELIIRYWSHVFPIAPGTESLKNDVKALLEKQHYLPSYWRKTMTGTLNYRRFFDVTTLAGIRVEDPSVFAQSHALILDQIKSGQLDGLRVDHPDGLADPKTYVDRLSEATGGSWIVIEKILEEGEDLPGGWKCQGTSGYDALIRLTGLIVDAEGEKPLTELYQKFAGKFKGQDFPKVVRDSKNLILEKSLVAEVERLVSLLVIIQKDDVVGRELSREGIKKALVEYLTSFDVYRAYIQPNETNPSPQSLHTLNHAAELAEQNLGPQFEREIDFVYRAALGKVAPTSPQQLEFVSRFQQTCGPVMAKGVEDTAFYRYFRLTALNEVGGDPGVFGKSVEEFHEASIQMQKEWPLSMTTLSTHDTKRSEDVRARLAVLSEVVGEWGDVVSKWSEYAREKGWKGGDDLPDANTEYLVWQTVVGCWPIEKERLVGYLEKACREGKVFTTHTEQSADFENSVKHFVERLYADQQILEEVEKFVTRIAPYGRINSLVQKVVQLLMPGVPDVYQGCEIEDYSLVDPDNRRPVDYTSRRHLLDELDREFGSAIINDSKTNHLPQIDASGRAKLFVVSRLLRLRRDRPDLFVGDGASYTPLTVSGEEERRVLAFGRSGE